MLDKYIPVSSSAVKMRIITLVSIVAPSGAFTVDSELVSDFM